MPPASEDKPSGHSVPAQAALPPSATRASDQERDATTQRLQTAFAEGRLDDEEFTTRMQAALRARTREELERLLVDLPEPPGSPDAAAPPLASERRHALVLAVMGTTRRRGRWRMPARCTTVAIMGGCVLDLRAAQLSAPVTTITAVAMMGSIVVLVPPGVRVEMHGMALMGSWSNRVREHHLPPEAPQVHIYGVALMGDVEARLRGS